MAREIVYTEKEYDRMIKEKNDKRKVFKHMFTPEEAKEAGAKGHQLTQADRDMSLKTRRFKKKYREGGTAETPEEYQIYKRLKKESKI
jgi:hypothetical protein